MACFADINVSQGNVATYANCGGIFNIHLTANLPRNLPVKKILKSVKIWQNYGHESVAPFLAHPVDRQLPVSRDWYRVYRLLMDSCRQVPELRLRVASCWEPRCEAQQRLVPCAADMELGHWVTGSMGHLGHLSRPGHRVIILTRCETRLFRFSKKNAQNAKRTLEMLKWQKSLSGVCCWTEITGCQSMQWTFTFTYDY